MKPTEPGHEESVDHERTYTLARQEILGGDSSQKNACNASGNPPLAPEREKCQDLSARGRRQEESAENSDAAAVEHGRATVQGNMCRNWRAQNSSDGG
jgi:hypothetical protein